MVCSRILCHAAVVCCGVLCPFAFGADADGEGVHVRFQLLEPQGVKYWVRLGGFIHKSPWYLPKAVWPEAADRDATRRVPAGECTPWFHLSGHAGDLLHGRLNRSGGVAELPNVTADFITDPVTDARHVVIELSTAPAAEAVAKRFEEKYQGSLTSFLVSPKLRRDAPSLECASEMSARRLAWAREASGRERVSPQRLILQTSFWAPQREELNLEEAEVLWLLGFNVVGNQTPAVREKYDFRVPGHTHDVRFGPGATRAEIDDLMAKHALRSRERIAPGVPFGFSDEICSRPPIGKDERSLAHFRVWLERQGISPKSLGAEDLRDAVPIETPLALASREANGAPAARRIFYYTSRFRQAALTERVAWHTESFHAHFGEGALTSTLVADHPYFSGTGLGMGMSPNPTWGGYPLAADWFSLARTGAVDLAGIEDWMGLQYMYGPSCTWEGFQLMGFQAAIFRSGSRGAQPIIAWVTPSDATNLRLKTASALCQGAKHFFYWTYGPTATSTENYWSDLRGAYEGVASVARQLAASEHIIEGGTTRKTRLALLYSISSDLWQPFGYVHMLDRRVTYLALVHDQYLVDMITEEDIEGGRLSEYDCLYVTDPCVKESAARRIREWVRAGGYLYGSSGAASRNEFNESVPGLSDVFGIAPEITTVTQPGRYHVRGALNELEYISRIHVTDPGVDLGAVGLRVAFEVRGATVAGTFEDGSAAVTRNVFGKGLATYVGTCPAIAYAKEARFVPAELREKWPAKERAFITSAARARRIRRLVEVSVPVVEAGVYDAPAGTAVVLANFTYEPIRGLRVTVPLPESFRAARSVERGPLASTVRRLEGIPARDEYRCEATVELDLDLSDVILFE